MEPITGIVLAGGKSSRMGVDKAGIRLRSGRTLIGSVADRLWLVASEVIVVSGGRTYPEAGAAWVRDIYPGAGPLGGIHAGLSAARCDYCLVVACDMPFLSVALLRHMVSIPRDYDVLIPRVARRFEPLHAVYSRRCLSPIESMLEAGRHSILYLFDAVRVRTLGEAVVAGQDPGGRSFVNINTPGDLVRWGWHVPLCRAGENHVEDCCASGS